MAQRIEASPPPYAPSTLTEPPVRRPPVRRRKRSFAWLWLLVLAAAGYGGYRYYETGQQAKKAAAAKAEARTGNRRVPVATIAATRGDMPIYLRGLGNVAAFNSVAVKTRVDGQLIAIHFTEGQFVQAGDLIAEIDPRPFQVQLEQAQGQLARDQAQLNDANVNLARYQALWEAQAIPKQQLDTQAAQVGQFKGTIEADKAAIDNAKLQLVYARITAPIGGRVGLRQIDVGNIVHASDPTGIVSIDQIEPISVFFTIPADSLPPVLKKLRAGAKLRVEAYDRSDTNKIATGTLLTVDNQIDPNTGTSRLKSVFDNADHALFPNQFVNCRLLLDVAHGLVIIPSAAIERGPQGNYVYIVKDNTANLRVVTTGATEGNNTAIDSGLQPGEMVVLDGQDKLQEGSKVDARAPNPNRPPRRANKP